MQYVMMALLSNLLSKSVNIVFGKPQYVAAMYFNCRIIWEKDIDCSGRSIKNRVFLSTRRRTYQIPPEGSKVPVANIQVNYIKKVLWFRNWGFITRRSLIGGKCSNLLGNFTTVNKLGIGINAYL